MSQNTIKSVQSLLKEMKISVLLLLTNSFSKSDPNLSYFTGINPEYALLAIPKKGSPKLYVPKFELQRLKRQSSIRSVVAIKKPSLLKQVKKDFKNPKRIALNYNIISVNELKGFRKIFRAKFFDLSKNLSVLRSIKSDKELKIIKKSCQIASKILTNCIKNFRNFKKFKSEQDVKDFLESQTKRHNCTFSFPPIVASGKNSAQPHYSGAKKLNKGFCVIDFGVKYKGYCSDITRTIYLGKPSKKEIDTYNKVLSVQLNCIKLIKKGVKTPKPYNFAYKKLGKNFTHGLGHGIGVEIHEFPNIVDRSRESFQPGMVFTIEPGLYLKNKFGIRIEDDFYIDKKGEIKQLTNLPKKMICVD